MFFLSFNSWDLPKGLSHLFLYCHILCTIVSHGSSLYPNMSQAVVSTGMNSFTSSLIKPKYYLVLQRVACVHCLMYAHNLPTDSWKHISVAEEVEVFPVLGSDSGAERVGEGEDEHGLCWDQTGPSPTQDSAHADGGALCFCSVLPTNQRAQCHEKVKLCCFLD